MSTLLFWKSWPNHLRHLYQGLLLLLALAFIFYFVGYFWSSRLLIQWDTISQLKTISLLLDNFQFAGIPLKIPADYYVISQIYQGSDIQYSIWPAYILLGMISCCLVLALAVVTDLSRFWFLASQIVFIFILVAFKLEQLLLFDRTDKVALILAFVLYLPAGYYLHAVKKEVSLLKRILVFGAITMLFAAVVYFFSGVNKPFFYLVSYGITVPIVLTVIFILFTAHEVIYGFLVLITRSNTPNSSNSFFHFFAISLIYLVNVLLLYLKNSRRIDWDFYYLDAFWIFIATTLIGIWGLRQRQQLYRNILPFNPYGAMGYLALAVVSFGTIGYFFATANDPTIEAFEDAIVFGQLSIGFMYLLYILFNFRSVLIENLKVYKVVYKPQKMPFFSMRLGGLIGILGLFLLSGQYPLNQAITGYYNGIGDLHREDGKDFLAREYYKLASIYAKTNHRSNYAVAAMYQDEGNNVEALRYYKQSLLKQPTPFAYVNTAILYQGQGNFFQALFTLGEGLKKFPKDAQITNNLAMLYARTEILDSAFYFLEQNQGRSKIASVTNTNLLALLMRTTMVLPLDSLVRSMEPSKPEVASNLILFAGGNPSGVPPALTPPSDSLLNPLTFSWRYNYTLNQRSGDSIQMQYLKRVAQLPSNVYYSSDLDFARAISQYYSGDITAAFSLLRQLQFTSNRNSGYYNDILGLWCLQQQAPRQAQDYFEASINNDYVPALWHLGVALSATGQLDQAKRYLGSYQTTAITDDLYSRDLLAFLQNDSSSVHNDLEKLWSLLFKNTYQTWDQKKDLVASIVDREIRSNAAKLVMEIFSGSADSPAARQWSQWFEDSVDGPTKALWKLRQAISEGDPSNISDLSSQVQSDTRLQLWNLYGQARKAESLQQQEEASKYYRKLVKNPFFTPGILAAATFFNQHGESGEAYDILLDAIGLNEYSIELLKEYGRQCIRLNLDNYAMMALETLSSLMPGGELEEYRQELETLAVKVQEETEIWDP